MATVSAMPVEVLLNQLSDSPSTPPLTLMFLNNSTTEGDPCWDRDSRSMMETELGESMGVSRITVPVTSISV